MAKMNWKIVFGFVLFCFMMVSGSPAEDFSLQYFLEKTPLKTYDLSKREKTELLNRIERILEQAKEVHSRLSRALQGGETDVKYQEGKFWMSKLEEDQASIESGAQQLKILREKPMQLTAAIKLYKALKDLSFHFNSCNNMPSFSAYIGDVAPEMELWTDPIFYKLYVLPLAQAKGVETKTPTKEKKTEVKGRK